MSASTNTVPAQMGFGRLPSAFAALALVVVIAVAVAIVALGSTKAAPLAESDAKGAPPPAIIDHGWSSAQYYAPAIPYVPTTPFNDHGWSTQVYSTETGTGTGGFGGWNGPRLEPSTVPGPRMRPQ